MVMRNKRYILWFWLLNLTLAEFGIAAFRSASHAITDHSLYSGGLIHGFDVGVLVELLVKPDFGKMNSMTAPSMCFAVLFFVATALFLPGIFAGYASTYRLPRDDFFRACGRNLWRFIRIMEDQQTKQLTGIPGLAQIPILRYLFGQTTQDHSENEIVFAIVPHIIRSNDVQEINQRAIDIGTATTISLHHASQRVRTARLK